MSSSSSTSESTTLYAAVAEADDVPAVCEAAMVVECNEDTTLSQLSTSDSPTRQARRLSAMEEEEDDDDEEEEEDDDDEEEEVEGFVRETDSLGTLLHPNMTSEHKRKTQLKRFRRSNERVARETERSSLQRSIHDFELQQFLQEEQEGENDDDEEEAGSFVKETDSVCTLVDPKMTRMEKKRTREKRLDVRVKRVEREQERAFRQRSFLARKVEKHLGEKRKLDQVFYKGKYASFAPSDDSDSEGTDVFEFNENDDVNTWSSPENNCPRVQPRRKYGRRARSQESNVKNRNQNVPLDSVENQDEDEIQNTLKANWQQMPPPPPRTATSLDLLPVEGKAVAIYNARSELQGRGIVAEVKPSFGSYRVQGFHGTHEEGLLCSVRHDSFEYLGEDESLTSKNHGSPPGSTNEASAKEGGTSVSSDSVLQDTSSRGKHAKKGAMTTSTSKNSTSRASSKKAPSKNSASLAISTDKPGELLAGGKNINNSKVASGSLVPKNPPAASLKQGDDSSDLDSHDESSDCNPAKDWSTQGKNTKKRKAPSTKQPTAQGKSTKKRKAPMKQRNEQSSTQSASFPTIPPGVSAGMMLKVQKKEPNSRNYTLHVTAVHENGYTLSRDGKFTNQDQFYSYEKYNFARFVPEPEKKKSGSGLKQIQKRLLYLAVCKTHSMFRAAGSGLVLAGPNDERWTQIVELVDPARSPSSLRRAFKNAAMTCRRDIKPLQRAFLGERVAKKVNGSIVKGRIHGWEPSETDKYGGTFKIRWDEGGTDGEMDRDTMLVAYELYRETGHGSK